MVERVLAGEDEEFVLIDLPSSKIDREYTMPRTNSVPQEAMPTTLEHHCIFVEHSDSLRNNMNHITIRPVRVDAYGMSKDVAFLTQRYI